MRHFSKLIKKKWVSYSIATCSAVILYMILSHMSSITAGFSSFFRFIRPVMSGLIVAYIFNPVTKLFDGKILKKMKNEKNRWKLSVAFTIIVILLAVVLLFVALIPQLIDSISTFINNVGGYVDALQKLLRQFEAQNNSGILGFDISKLADFGDRILTSISDSFSNNMGSIVNTSASIGKSVFDGVLAFILAIYFLLDKKKVKAGVSRVTGYMMKPETHRKTGEFIRRCNDIIIRYISFDIVDGIIVGLVNFVFMLIAGMPYSVLISVIVGVTNLAPTFGPIVGCVIGAFILVLVNPWYGLSFVIFTVILQTIDGYVLKPRLFGESLGVSPLMILISIILGGRLFGVIGILIAIPFAAILDVIWKDYLVKSLEEKHNRKYNI